LTSSTGKNFIPVISENNKEEKDFSRRARFLKTFEYGSRELSPLNFKKAGKRE